MKMSHIAAAAGLFIATLGVGSAADARPHRDVRWHDGYRDHGRHDYRHHGYYRGRGYAYRAHPRCWTEWRHHHRVRVCR